MHISKCEDENDLHVSVSCGHDPVSNQSDDIDAGTQLIDVVWMPLNSNLKIQQLYKYSKIMFRYENFLIDNKKYRFI